ncbi:MAG: GNAT family N-acetyltransferase [Planctomycetes bacterium]|nr:GNAT family N-acetyltransferase [Planctomycetota bacterium]
MIAIRPLAPPDFPTVAAWLSAPDVHRWLTSEWRGKAVAGPVIAMTVRNKRNDLYLIEADGRPAGLVALADLDPVDRCAMVWYVLGDSGSGRRGIVTEGVRLLARRAFAELGLRCLYAWIMPDNQASRRVLEKNGFRPAGRLRNATESDGVPADRVYYDLVPGDLGL